MRARVNDRAALAGYPRLVEALHPLDVPPSGPAWNHAEVADLLPGPTPSPEGSGSVGAAARIAEAAVLVGLVPRHDGARVLLTLRNPQLRQHAGQVSFPGGRLEPQDRDVVAGAIRETVEEIGLLPQQIRPLGYLDPLATISGFRVLPVVALIDTDYVARPDPEEVAEVFEVPLQFLLDPANLAARALDYRGRRREVLEYRYPPQRIWGATASILLNLRKRLEDLQ